MLSFLLCRLLNAHFIFSGLSNPDHSCTDVLFPSHQRPTIQPKLHVHAIHAAARPHPAVTSSKYQGVGLPRKYLGHGICDARSKLLNLGRATADASTLKSHALHLLKEAKVPPDKIRGIGLQMTRLVPAADGDGVGGAGGSSFGGGKGGPFGALHGWLVKPGGVEGEQEEQEKVASDAPQGAAAPAPATSASATAAPLAMSASATVTVTSTATAAPTTARAAATAAIYPATSAPTKPTKSTAARQASPWSVAQGPRGSADGAPSTARKDAEEIPASLVHPLTAEGTVDALSREAEGGGGRVALQQRLSATTTEASGSGVEVSPRSHKRRRQEEGRDDQGAPRNDDRAPPRQKHAASLVSDAAATTPSTSRARTSAAEPGSGATSERADGNGGGAEVAVALARSSNATRKPNSPGTEHTGTEKATDVGSIGGSATPPRTGQHEQHHTAGASDHEAGSPDVASPRRGALGYQASASQGGDGLSPLPSSSRSATRRRRREPGSPEVLSPPTGVVGSPSMSQVGGPG